MLLTSITQEQVDDLDYIFATLTEDGWVIPDWLVYLRDQVCKRDYRLGLTF